MNLENFKTVTKQVIENLEGGYFHPNMRLKNPSKFALYDKSGETLFGLDRHAGHSLYYKGERKKSNVLANLPYIESNVYTYISPAAKEFWQTIDNSNAKINWVWNYRGGNLENKLTDLAALIIYPQFTYLFKKYLSKKAQNIVENNDKILFHFIYATWNGSGWFKKFADIFNKAVEKNINENELVNVALNSRLNSSNTLIKMGGEKIKKLFSKDTQTNVSDNKNKIITTIVIGLAILGYMYFKK